MDLHEDLHEHQGAIITEFRIAILKKNLGSGKYSHRYSSVPSWTDEKTHQKQCLRVLLRSINTPLIFGEERRVTDDGARRFGESKSMRQTLIHISTKNSKKHVYQSFVKMNLHLHLYPPTKASWRWIFIFIFITSSSSSRNLHEDRSWRFVKNEPWRHHGRATC